MKEESKMRERKIREEFEIRESRLKLELEAALSEAQAAMAELKKTRNSGSDVSELSLRGSV
jgi:hypothetical protein